MPRGNDLSIIEKQELSDDHRTFLDDYQEESSVKVYADPIIQICIKMEPEDLRKVYPDDVFFEPGSGVKNHRGTQRFRAFVKLFFLVKDKDYWGNEQKIEAATLTLHYIKLRHPAVSFWKKQKENGQYKRLDEEEKMSQVKGTIGGYSKDRTKIDEKSFETDKDILSFYEKVKGEGNVQAVVTKVKELLMKDFNLAAYDETMTGISNKQFRARDDNQTSKRLKAIQYDESPNFYEILEVHTLASPPVSVRTKFAVVEKKTSSQDNSGEQEDEYRLDNFFLCDEERNIVASIDISMVAKQAKTQLGVSDDNYPLNRLMGRRRNVVLSLSTQFKEILESFCHKDTVLPKIFLTKQYLYSVRNSSIENHEIWVEEKLNGKGDSSLAVFKADYNFEGQFCSDLFKPDEETQLIRMLPLEQDDKYEDFNATPENILHAFSYFSSLHSPYLLAEVKYVYFAQEKLFKLTDPIIYSDGLSESFGSKDLGKNGINKYKREHLRNCANPICKRLGRHFQNLSKTYLTKT